jgi:hypothetical protein
MSNFQEVAAVDDLKLTITSRMFMYMKWTDPRIIHNKTSKDELAIMVRYGYGFHFHNFLTMYIGTYIFSQKY